MVASRETLQDLAAERQLQPATLERVIRLIDILDAFGADTLIGPRVALKGGTALNVFHSNLDRLSIDIDVNYVGAIEKERMDADRPGLEDRIERLMESKGYAARREPAYTKDHWEEKALPGLVCSSVDAANSVRKLRRI